MADLVGFAGGLAFMAIFALVAAYRSYRWNEIRRFKTRLLAGLCLSVAALGVGWLGWMYPFYGFHKDAVGDHAWDCNVSWSGDPICTRQESSKSQ
jgi:hypothetical protein